VDVLVTPFEVVDDALVSQLLLDNEDVLEEFYYSFVDVKMVELSDHCLLIFKVLFILVYQSIAFVND